MRVKGSLTRLTDATRAYDSPPQRLTTAQGAMIIALVDDAAIFGIIGRRMAGESKLPERVTRYRWVVVGLWLVCTVSGFMVVSTIGILLPSITSELRLSPGQQGILGSSAFWGVAIAIPLSWWSSRFGPKSWTTVTLVLAALFLLLQGWATAFAVLLLGRLGFGIATLAREPARGLLFPQWFHQREIILVNAVSHALFGIVVGGGLLVTPHILDLAGDSWRTVFYTFAGFFTVLTALWMALGRERAHHVTSSGELPRESGGMVHALSYWDLWVGSIGFLGTNLARSAFLSFFPTLMLHEYGVSLQWSGAVLAIAALAGGAAGLGMGHLVTITHKRNSILLALGVIMTGTYAGMTQVGSVPLLVSLGILNGVAWGFFPVLYTLPFHLPGIRPREVAVGLALIMSMIAVGTISGPLLTGFLQEALGGNLKLSLLIASSGAILLSVGGILLRSDDSRSEDEPSQG